MDIINVQDITISLYPAGLFCIPVRHSEPTSFIIHEPIKGDLAFRAEVKPYSGKHVIGSTLTAVSEGIVESTDHGVVKAFLTKKSTEPAALNNANYSLAGAEYQLYETEAKA